MGKKEEQEMHRDERIEQTGQLTLTDNKEETSIHLLTIIGEIEGMTTSEAAPKRQNMNIFCRSWRR